MDILREEEADIIKEGEEDTKRTMMTTKTNRSITIHTGIIKMIINQKDLEIEINLNMISVKNQMTQVECRSQSTNLLKHNIEGDIREDQPIRE